MEDRTKVCIYARVSTSAQDYKHQLKSLRDFAKKNNYEVVKEFSEKISGAKKIHDRLALLELMEFVREHPVDKILIFECSRLSRRASDFLNIIEELNDLGISLHILQNGLETLLPDKTVNPIASLVCGIIAQFNSMERSLIRSRMAAGYENYRENGGVVGRKEGFKKPDRLYLTEYSKELELLRRGVRLKDIRTITGTAINTLRKLKSKFLTSA
jgi:DNA invertase Pin-like site-specific DNA recombinase